MKRTEKLVFKDISEKQFEAIQTRAKAEGLALGGQKGLLTWDHGIGIDWSYDANKELLAFQASIPFGISANEVEGALSAIVRHTATYSADNAAEAEAVAHNERNTEVAAEEKRKAVVPVITWPTPAPIAFPTPLSAAQLNATASVPGTYAYSPGPGAVLPAGTHRLSVVFTPTDAFGYETASSSTTLTVN
jgi:hypothetical protein